MSFLSAFTLSLISCQTLFAVILAWFTLDCQMAPNSSDLREVTFIKLLYLYDPIACGRPYPYNYTFTLTRSITFTTIFWPVKNNISSLFRSKVKIWLTAHIFWILFYISYKTQSRRPLGFYVALLPFTLIGIGIIFIKIAFFTMFIIDTKYTSSEHDILNYISATSGPDCIHWINKTNRNITFDSNNYDNYNDTSWISLLFAFSSIGGVVTLVFDFWVIEDNFFEGAANYRRLFTARQKRSTHKPSDNSLDDT